MYLDYKTERLTILKKMREGGREGKEEEERRNLYHINMYLSVL